MRLSYDTVQDNTLIDDLAMSGTPAIAVIGSLNVDFITTTPRIPEAGETMTATSFTTGFGGKGANQAVACSRLSKSRPQSQQQEAGSLDIKSVATSEVKTQMIGFLGSDPFGADYRNALVKEGIDVANVRTVEGVTTGVANIIVEESSGENRIMLSTGANYSLGEKLEDLVPEEAVVVIFQLEIPLGLVSWHVSYLFRRRCGSYGPRKGLKKATGLRNEAKKKRKR